MYVQKIFKAFKATIFTKLWHQSKNEEIFNTYLYQTPVVFWKSIRKNSPNKITRSLFQWDEFSALSENRAHKQVGHLKYLKYLFFWSHLCHYFVRNILKNLTEKTCVPCKIRLPIRTRQYHIRIQNISFCNMDLCSRFPFRTKTQINNYNLAIKSYLIFCRHKDESLYLRCRGIQQCHIRCAIKSLFY